jgi:hypothetical protein
MHTTYAVADLAIFCWSNGQNATTANTTDRDTTSIMFYKARSSPAKKCMTSHFDGVHFKNSHLRKLVQVIKLFIGLVVGFFALSVNAKDMPTVDPKLIIATYGKPDKIKSTEYDKPRPPFVTRMLEYKNQNVRFSLLANAPMGSPPPYSSWKLLGYQDLRDNSVISAEEMANRMRPRKK